MKQNTLERQLKTARRFENPAPFVAVCPHGNLSSTRVGVLSIITQAAQGAAGGVEGGAAGGAVGETVDQQELSPAKAPSLCEAGKASNEAYQVAHRAPRTAHRAPRTVTP